jgi:tape measure domain-containing protein
MAESIVKLIVDASQGVRSLGRFKKATDEAAKKTDQLKKAVRLQKAATEAATTKLAQFGDIAKSAFGKASKAAQKYQSALGGIKGAIVSLGVAALTKRMIGQAASFQQTQIRLKALSTEYGEFGKIQQLVKDNAKTFNLSQAEAASQFSDVYARLRPLGKTLDEVQTVYKGFNATAIASGTSAAAASGAFLQLSQALGSGRLAGDEFRSVSEQIPGILGLVADEMGVAVSELKKLGSEGKITSDILINALAKGFEKNKDKIQQILAESPAAKFKEFSNATSELSNAIGTELLPVVTPAVQGLTKLLKAVSDLPGPIKTVGAAILGLTSAVVGLAPLLGPVAKGFAAIKSVLAGITGAGLLAAGPWFALAAGIGAAAFALNNYQFEAKNAGTAENLKRRSAELLKIDEDLAKAEARLDKQTDKQAIKAAQLTVDSFQDIRQRKLKEIAQIREALPFRQRTNQPKGAPTARPQIGDFVGGGSSGGDSKALKANNQALEEANRLANSQREAFARINQELDRSIALNSDVNDYIKQGFQNLFAFQDVVKRINTEVAAGRQAELIALAQLKKDQADFNVLKGAASDFGSDMGEFFAGKLPKEIEAQGEKMKDVYKGIGDSIQNGVVDALTAAVDGTKSLAEVASATLKDIGSMLIKFGVNQLFNQAGGAGGILGKLFGSAKGNIIAQNKIVPFAKGGIIGEPTIFPLANGTGLMGEAGPEAIMPLKRGPSGRLGVEVASTRQQLDRQRAVASTREQLNNQQANTMQPLDIRYESTVINNIEYVTAEQHRKGMAQAAERGRAMTLTTLQNSPRTRSRVGI